MEWKSDIEIAQSTPMEPITKIAADQAAFLDQKDLAGGKKTLKAYYWKICGDQYDSNQG